MKNKLGFTLVELLAVIVILAIIIVIAVPKIMNIIERVEKASYKSTILILENKVKQQYQISNLENQSETAKNYTFTDGIIEPKIEVTGKLPTNGFIEINNNSTTQLRLLNDKYCALKRFEDNDVVVFDVHDRLCNIVVDVALNVNLDHGSTTQVFNSRYNSNTTLDLIDPTKAGHIFTGWNVTGATINDDTLNIGNEDIDLLAEWDIEEYDITYTLNDGTIEGENPISYTISDDDITLINPSKYGYAFDGWTGSNGDIPQKTIILPSGSIGEKNYIANWTLITYTIKYNCDENSGSIPDSIHEYGVSKPLSTSNCFKVTEGNFGMVYYVSQWKTSLLPDAITYDAEEEVLNLTETPNEIINLYPVWADVFSYDTGYSVEDDGDGKWRIKLKRIGSGTFIPSYNMNVDIFLVGGGGGGGKSPVTSGDQAGGGGGYTVTETNIPLIGGNDYTATIGAGGVAGQDGKTTSIEVDGTTYSAPGGQKGEEQSSDGYKCGWTIRGGAGGSGGGGCYDSKGYKGGSDGADGTRVGGIGQDNTEGYASTTREFGEASGDLYSGGGSGQSCYECQGGTGADGGGGKACSNGVSNTGGGGGGRYNGGSGIIVIREHKT